MNAMKTAAIIIIGDEILSGRTLDSNTQTIAQKLGAVGIQLSEVRIVPDVIDTVISAVHTLKDQVDYVFTTGGIGPTHDDKTAEAMAKAFDKPYVRHAGAWDVLIAHYRGEENINEGRAKMAMMPEGVRLIDNPVSGAPGFIVENVYVMAGVPNIMAAMLDGVIPNIQGGVVVLSQTIVFDLPESIMASAIGCVQDAHPDVAIGSYPRFQPNEKNSVSVVIKGTDKKKIDAAVVAIKHAVCAL